MAVICNICKAKMPTLRVLEQHMAKRHASSQPQSGQIVEPAASTENVHVVEQEGVPAGMVKIVSADDRVLECSVNQENWKGKEIIVPAHLEGEVRRLLKSSGFFLQN